MKRAMCVTVDAPLGSGRIVFRMWPDTNEARVEVYHPSGAPAAAAIDTTVDGLVESLNAEKRRRA